MLLSVLSWMVSPAFATGLARPTPELLNTPVQLPPAKDIDPLLVDGDLKAWLDRNVSKVGSANSRMARLLSALGRRALEYDDAHTRTASETFDEGRFNCLGLAHLVVAAGRHLGVDAYYVRILEEPEYGTRGTLVLASTHIAAAWGPSGQVRVVELANVDAPSRRATERISDRAAASLHYANRGAEILMAGRPRIARPWLQAAVLLDADAPGAWVNLGVAERRLGAAESAEAAYLQALQLAPDNSSAWKNLAQLRQLEGRPMKAQEMLEALRRPGYRNAFTYLDLGDMHLRTGALDEAGALYRRALRIDRRAVAIRAAMGEWWLAGGDRDRAARWLQRSRRLDPDHPRVRRLAAALKPPQLGPGT
ncbi:MAG: tetratricopeptide repeat protein [Myxococcales bacterium]|nr:tetratricopeptide repeat protein [Myxococcales bacterium]